MRAFFVPPFVTLGLDPRVLHLTQDQYVKRSRVKPENDD